MFAGEAISHYRILKLLGAGGMGEVYQAEDTRLKRLVALKFLPPALVQDRDAKERLVHEAQAASALDHPNICTIHEIDETPDGRLFVAMAYYEGETLKERIARAPFTIDDAIEVIAQMARAIAAAHAAGIVHRDIKPANVILTTRGEVKLLDFGIAKLPGQTALTRTGTTLGTIAYMAPEQIGGQAADERSDAWALGVVLYEMLAGGLPFGGGNELAIIRAIADGEPKRLRAMRSDVPAAVDAIVARALQKEPRSRFSSAQEFLDRIETLRAPKTMIVSTETPSLSSARRWAIAAAAASLLLGIGGWYAYRQAQIRSGRQALQRVAELIRVERRAEAYVLARRIEPALTRDPEFASVRDALFGIPSSIRTNPPGADLYLKPYADARSAWEHLGQSPLQVPGTFGYFRWRVTKPGFAAFEGAAGLLGENRFVLAPDGAVPPGMVYVPAGSVVTATGSVQLTDYFIDRFEVTNRDFKKFIDAGGYRSRAYWTEPFVKDGRTVAWDEAIGEFRDATGRPGPSTWELGTYPEGQDDYPVHGINWYEAAAFARFAGKALPTVHHWRNAAGLVGERAIFSDILESSNFSGKGPARVGEYAGIGPYGTADMAGNVKEWCWNAVDDRHYILGGGWNEPTYQFRGDDARLPFDRSASNGFRTIKLKDAAALPEITLRPVERLKRDYGREKPVADNIFRTYESLYGYDPSDLGAKVESVDDSASTWHVERITYAAVYGNERIVAYLFLPKNASPPYQTVVYFPHSSSTVLRSFEKAEMGYLGFIVKAGRALLLPMYKGTYERRLVPPPSGPNALRDLVIQQMKDLRRSVDYLQTRRDVDRDRLAYFGVSMGAREGSIALAVEKRFKAAVLWSGGFAATSKLPEIDEINYAPRVTTPVLMLNGRDDFTFPIDSAQVPMFNLLGPPEPDKRRVLYDGGHVFPFARIQKDTLDWLDRYLGAPR